MNFFGNENDPLAKTLKDLNDKSSDSTLESTGNFFDPVHERDTHVKPPTNVMEDVLEFNAALLTVDDPTTMLEYIILRNKITEEECYIIEESNHVDKTSGETTVFIKWFQPKGSFELGTARFNAGYKMKKDKDNDNDKDKDNDNAKDKDKDNDKDKQEDSSRFPGSQQKIDKRTKGSRKWNRKVKL